jgi:hypothetical protein
MNAEIMVSYSSKDRDHPLLAALFEDLRSLDHPFWYDQHLHEGFSWWSEITERIATCQVVVVALTAKSARSRACKLELAHAIATGRRILPVLMEDLPQADLPQELLATQMVRFVERLGDVATAGRCVAKLGTAIDSLLAIGTLPPATNVEPPPIPPSYIDPLRPFLDSAAIDLDEQFTMIAQAENLVNDDEDDRRVLRDAVHRLSEREDISWKVRTRLQTLLQRIEAGARPGGAGRRSAPQVAPRGKQQARRAQSFSIPAAYVDVRRLADQLERWYQSQGLETGTAPGTTPSAVVVQCQSGPRARRTGTAVALTVELANVDGAIEVRITNRWRDKAATLGGAFVASVASGGALLPLLAAPAIGGYRQTALASRTVDYIKSVASAA